MKATLTILAVLLLATSPSFGQSIPFFQFGAKGALNFSELKSGDGKWLDSKTKTGYQIGAWARIGGGLHFQPELYFTKKTTEAASTDNPGQKGDISFSSIDLPLLIGQRFGLGPVGVRINAGPVVSFVVDKNVPAALKSVTDFSTYKDQSIALTAGVGADLSKLRVDVRYEKGLTKLNHDGAKSQRLSLWTVGLGYRIF